MRFAKKLFEIYKKGEFWIIIMLQVTLFGVAFFLRETLSTDSLYGFTILFAMNLQLRYIGQFCHLNIYSLQKKIIRRQQFLRICRFARYILAIVLIMDANKWCLFSRFNISTQWFPAVNMKWLKGSFLLYFGAILWLDLCDTLVRLTFRKWSSYMLSTSAILLFLVFMGLPYIGDKYAWGLVDLSNMMDIVKKITQDFTGEIVAIAAIGSFALYVARSIFEAQRKKLYSGVIKDARRSLLSHWHFQPGLPISANTVIWTILIFSFVCSATVFFTFTYTSEQETDTAKTTEICMTVTSEESFVEVNGYIADAKSESENDSNESLVMQFFAILATVIAILGFIGYWLISDKALVEDEYYYLLYHSIYLRNKKINAAGTANKWEDYFQVLAYLYNGMSPMYSEAKTWHNVVPVLQFVYRGGKEGRSAEEQAEFISRFIHAYAQVRMQYQFGGETEFGKPENSSILYNPLSEEMFSKALQDIINS